jgi:hypothetical protein
LKKFACGSQQWKEYVELLEEVKVFGKL